jgi:hypothetical protein
MDMVALARGHRHHLARGSDPLAVSAHTSERLLNCIVLHINILLDNAPSVLAWCEAVGDGAMEEEALLMHQPRLPTPISVRTQPSPLRLVTIPIFIREN